MIYIKKKDLKTGMVVEMRHGEKYLVMLNPDDEGRSLVSFQCGWMCLDDYNEDLSYRGLGNDWDIVKVYRLENHSIGSLLFDKSLLEYKLLWENPARLMTLEEIEKELGYPVKIVKKHKGANGNG